MRNMVRVVFVFAVVFAEAVGQQAVKSEAVWRPAVYKELTVGVSTKNEALQALGKPTFSGREQDTGIPIISFNVTSPIAGSLTVYLKKGVVDGLTLTPKVPLTRQQAVHILGVDYLRVRYATDDCLTEGGSAPIYESPNGSIEHLEYRKRGIAIVLRDDDVKAIVYVHRAFGPKRSRCSNKRSN